MRGSRFQIFMLTLMRLPLLLRSCPYKKSCVQTCIPGGLFVNPLIVIGDAHAGWREKAALPVISIVTGSALHTSFNQLTSNLPGSIFIKPNKLKFLSFLKQLLQYVIHVNIITILGVPIH